MNEIIKFFPWVFWIRFEKREWFSNFWKARGSNCLDIQIFKIHVSIGMPWHKEALRYASEDTLNGYKPLISANKTFTKWYHIHIGSYDKIRL